MYYQIKGKVGQLEWTISFVLVWGNYIRYRFQRIRKTKSYLWLDRLIYCESSYKISCLLKRLRFNTLVITGTYFAAAIECACKNISIALSWLAWRPLLCSN